MKKGILFSLFMLMAASAIAKVKVIVKTPTPQTEYAATRLATLQGNATIRITIRNAGEPEAFTIQGKGKNITITGSDGAGAIYGANYVRENFTKISQNREKFAISSAPEMKLRGACVGLQKTVYLPEGRWVDTKTKTVFTRGTYTVKAELTDAVAFVREGAEVLEAFK